MLYVTTRNSRDAYTAQRALCEPQAPDGGFYIPMRMPRFTWDQISALKDIPFNECLARMLNLMFKTRLTGWDIEFCVGRHPVKLRRLNQRILAAECWRNTGWTFRHMVRLLADKIRSDAEPAESLGDWAEIGVRIAVLFALTGQLQREQILVSGETLDVSVMAGDFTGAMSLWYARSWGLPIRTIICSCGENSGLWDLMHQGQLRTAGPRREALIPETGTVVPRGLERLISACGGPWEAERFAQCCSRGALYTPEEVTLSRMKRGLRVSVISDRRILTTISGAWATHGYLMSPDTALAYAGLLDHRASAGGGSWGLILSDRSPGCDPEQVSGALGITVEELKKRIDIM